MSELLRFQQRERQVGEQADGHDQTDGVIEEHILTSLESFAAGDVAETDDEKYDGHKDEHQIEHRSLPPITLADEHDHLLPDYLVRIKNGHKGG